MILARVAAVVSIIGVLLTLVANAQIGPLGVGPNFLINSIPRIPIALGQAIVLNANPVTTTITHSAPTGATIIVGCQVVNASSLTVTSVSDGTNAYSKIVGGYSSASVMDSELWYSTNVSALSIGTNIKCNFSSTPSGSIEYSAVVAAYVTNLAASPLDKSNGTAFSSSSSPASGSTGTLSQTDEVAFGLLSVARGASFSITEAPNFTTLINVGVTGTTFQNINLAYQYTNATTALNYQPTLSGASQGWALIATFKQ